MNMTVGASEQIVFHSLTQTCTLKMEKSQQISTENPQIDICIYFHHLGAQHIFLTTYLISNNIPYSLAYRIVQICSKPELRDAQFSKLRNFLLSKDYNS